ncbi:hypothetical protein HDF16_005151 [Granulicella aggregans]|uniref:Uncharacterized protein n=1 Tax=Granulicella aggregans TaxID=474949 RepID=A0A7W7ZI86_9BACT|nr:hypothetical protein [Granulicella aggregans]
MTAIMILDVAGTTFGLATDHTVITGTPAWVKPLKFGVSSGIYSASLAVVIRETKIWTAALKIVDFATAAALVLEVALINLQAFRHTTSHFNNSTPFDRNVFLVMAIGIAILWLSAVLVTSATMRYQYSSALWGIVARVGMALVVLGAGTGAFMVPPSPSQIAVAQVTHRMPISGSHTVGAPDGGPGLPVLGWSMEHGDIRIAHFVGIHGLQGLGLLALLFNVTKVDLRKAEVLIRLGAGIYSGLFFLLLYQALKGEPLLHPDHFVKSIFAVLFVAAIALSVAAMNSVGTAQPMMYPRSEARHES